MSFRKLSLPRTQVWALMQIESFVPKIEAGRTRQIFLLGQSKMLKQMINSRMPGCQSCVFSCNSTMPLGRTRGLFSSASGAGPGTENLVLLPGKQSNLESTLESRCRADWRGVFNFRHLMGTHFSIINRAAHIGLGESIPSCKGLDFAYHMDFLCCAEEITGRQSPDIFTVVCLQTRHWSLIFRAFRGSSEGSSPFPPHSALFLLSIYLPSRVPSAVFLGKLSQLENVLPGEETERPFAEGTGN